MQVLKAQKTIEIKSQGNSVVSSPMRLTLNELLPSLTRMPFYYIVSMYILYFIYCVVFNLVLIFR